MNYRATLAIALGLGVISYGLVTWNQIRHSNQARQQQTNAAQAHGEAIAHVDQAKTSDEKAGRQAQAIQGEDSEVQRLRREVARLRKANASLDTKTPEGVDTPQPVPPSVDLAPLVAKQDDLIQAQDREIQWLKTHVTTISDSRDQWKLAYEAERRRATSLELALAAQASAAKAARWRGRIEGLAVGLATGYFAGRLQ